MKIAPILLPAALLMIAACSTVPDYDSTYYRYQDDRRDDSDNRWRHHRHGRDRDHRHYHHDR